MEVLGHIEGVRERENGSIEETMSRRDGGTARLKIIEAGPFFPDSPSPFSYEPATVHILNNSDFLIQSVTWRIV
jgi:hypothetical protein